MKTKLIYLNLLILLSSTLVHAQLNGQLYTQKILNITDQWHTLDIPVSVLSKAKKNQSDIRIVGITADNPMFSIYHANLITDMFKANNDLELEMNKLINILGK